ncbi:MAG: hypothetical protein JNL45_14140 [Hyphomicrobium sp.]|nr:hypothetical protein [Hyphomicrobium sp.]
MNANPATSANGPGRPRNPEQPPTTPDGHPPRRPGPANQPINPEPTTPSPDPQPVPVREPEPDPVTPDR